MKVVKILSMGREMLKLLSENEVRIGDWKYVKMYEEYQRMRENGLKYRAVIAELALCYSMSRSKVERIIQRLGRDVK